MAEGFPEYPPRTALPNLVLHESTIRDKVDATKIAGNWLSSLLKSIADNDAAALADLFFAEAWWRDLIALSWTITSKNGPHVIADLLLNSKATMEHAELLTNPPLAPQLVDMGPMTIIQFGFSFRTQHAYGRGVVRLGNDGPDSWKAWTASTQLEELLDQAASTTTTTQTATNGTNGHVDEDEHLQVLIVGAGQSGVMLGAWLKELGIKYLILDKQARAGDAWRARYASVKSHTPLYTDHFPFLNFPSNWPKWLERDAIADWIEHYSAIMGLDVLPNATVSSVDRDADTGKYSVKVSINGGTEQQRVYKATHFVLATGVFPPIPSMPDFLGRASFTGQVYHTVHHKTATQIKDLGNKKIAIIGAGTSAHDIAQDFVNHGAKAVTMIQRGRLFAASTDSIEKLSFTLWNTPGINLADADLLGGSMPLVIALTLSSAMAPAMVANDAAMLDGLGKAGVALARGEDGISLWDYQAVKLGHFYIDQGAADMIIDGRIQVRRCKDGVRGFNETGVELADGTQVDADVVLVATGYKPMQATAEELLGEEIAQKANAWADLNAESERPGLCCPTGVPGLWYMAGSFMMCRQFSKLLAMQIAAVERGMNPIQFASS